MIKRITTLAILISLLAVLLGACGGSSSPKPSDDGLKDLLDAVDAGGNLDTSISITVKNSIATTKLAPLAKGAVEPVLVEVEGKSPAGRPFKALLVGSSENALAAGFSGQLRVKAKKTTVKGENVIAGYAALLNAPDINFPGFAFLAVKTGLTLDGPEVGSVYNMDGKAALKGFCTDQHLVGASLFKNRLETVRVISATVALLNDRLPCEEGKQIDSEVQMNFESEVVNTHLGKVLSSYGVMEVKQGDSSYTMPVFTLGVPEVLSNRIKQERFEAKVADNVYVLTPFFMSEIEKIAGGVVYLRSLPAGYENLKAGDLLVSRPFPRLPEGLLRQVTSVQQSEKGVAIATSGARLEQLIQEGGFSFSRPISPEDLTEDIAGFDGVDFSSFNDIETLRAEALASQGLATQALDLLPRINISKTIVGDLKLEGYFDLGVQPVFEFDCRGGLCAELKVVGKFIVTEEAQLALHGNHNESYS
ncbi:MAG: hypothetical protein KC422_26105, partial [Trueperaceae bacterium]|nr:hypothetical protein [Trueperaceae bacterium]